ncbi:hypothetical protein DIZ76_016923 [Coccidioides immitis]|nr:hypothetical protein DIZ76_016923 [Coccidioides immitis]
MFTPQLLSLALFNSSNITLLQLATRPFLMARPVSTQAPSPFQVNDSSNKDTDDPTISSELREFQASLLAQPDDTKRFQQCVAKQDKLLARHEGIKVLIADYNE